MSNPTNTLTCPYCEEETVVELLYSYRGVPPDQRVKVKGCEHLQIPGDAQVPITFEEVDEEEEIARLQAVVRLTDRLADPRERAA